MQRALDLLESKCDPKGIRGYATSMGVIVRYDPIIGDFAKGHPRDGVITMFKPKNGNLYFESHKKSEEKRK